MSERIEPTTELCVEKCGAKCCRMEGHMILSFSEGSRLHSLNKKIKLINHAVKGYVVWNRSGPCVFLDQKTNLCTIYESRPEACRTFPKRPNPGCLAWPVEEKNNAST